ncbi:BlaI/MecI/CopY family transcriptional regulator [Pleionea sp. CnH1-48]|uniref:BlaI/MecI/CopY family transcriptional regulator n=1 Tax=Pleionea sp. CnH1-48 TaxID=2954494 RepID=UPI002097ED27|nr:BlaI/MecI/CopY family transcriptional regulator [Pleionea sp. CnH1-48]MCO7227484.1 BlaI/MecI/CopY family transcriptional regulator [Pleionea sp. CnH1-48]
MTDLEIKLSDFEMEVMQLLWQHQEASAPELHKQIASERKVTYSTVKTIIDRLEEKGAIARSRQQGRTIFYQPVLAQTKFSKPLVKRFLQRVFGGQSRPLFSHLLEDETLDKDDIAYLESLIQKKKQQLGD